MSIYTLTNRGLEIPPFTDWLWSLLCWYYVVVVIIIIIIIIIIITYYIILYIAPSSMPRYGPLILRGGSHG